MKREVTIKYDNGHSYDFEYEKTDLFCPSCGKQTVWFESSEGDFYEGPTHVCTECTSSFTLPSMGVAYTDLIKQLKQEKLEKKHCVP